MDCKKELGYSSLNEDHQFNEISSRVSKVVFFPVFFDDPAGGFI